MNELIWVVSVRLVFSVRLKVRHVNCLNSLSLCYCSVISKKEADSLRVIVPQWMVVGLIQNLKSVAKLAVSTISCSPSA